MNDRRDTTLSGWLDSGPEKSMYLFFDTETTGKLLYKKPLTHPDQPRLVQIAAVLRDNIGQDILNMNAIIRPDGFEIPEEASNIHGITHDVAVKRGISINDVISLFHSLCSISHTIVGHNVDFDMKIMEIEYLRLQYPHYMPEKSICTMKSSTDLCQLPGNYGYKWPKLQELYKFLFKEEFEEAHNALHDLRATIRCFDELRVRGVL